MSRFPERFINQVQQATDIVDVVGQYVALKKRGKEFVGLCPFHEDHRPSLYVSPTKQIYKCFACGAGGGIFQFLMALQKVSFPEAVRQLAERAGVPVPAAEPAEGADRSLSRETLIKATTFAARFYRDRLLAQAGSAALGYARGRGLSDESIRRFGLGYAPGASEAMRSAARGAGFSDRQLLAAGLLSQRADGSCYDRFRDRLMFPILDVAGKVIAFGGRALSEDQPAKYLNSPDTVLFDKSANLYGLNWARQEIARTGEAVVVEGYLDALMCHQAGLGNFVATLGTALTERHVRLLGRYARQVVLVFDADIAGQAAAERAIELFLTQRLDLRVATVPASGGAEQVKDPCDYVLSAGAEAMRELLASAPDALGYAWSRRADEYRRAGTLAAKREVLDAFLRLVVSSAAYGGIDALRQGLVVGHVAELVGISPRDVAERMRQLARQVRRPVRVGPAEERAGDSAAPPDRAERWILGALLNSPGLFASVREKVRPGMFRQPALRALAEQVWRLAEQDKLDLAGVLGAGQSQQWGQIVTDVHVDGERRGNYERTLAEAMEHLLRRREAEQLQELKEKSDMDEVALMRKISDHARRPDPRRRPRLT